MAFPVFNTLPELHDSFVAFFAVDSGVGGAQDRRCGINPGVNVRPERLVEIAFVA